MTLAIILLILIAVIAYVAYEAGRVSGIDRAKAWAIKACRDQDEKYLALLKDMERFLFERFNVVTDIAQEMERAMRDAEAPSKPKLSLVRFTDAQKNQETTREPS